MAAEIQSPYSIAEVAALTGFSNRTVTKLFETEPGVIVYQASNPRRMRKGYRSLRIPRHVYQRVMRRLSVQ
jgi:transcriptional regulator GlxA family with amidase domain